MTYVKDGKLYYQFDAETMMIESWGEDSLRIRSWKTSQMPEHDWALTEAPKERVAKIELKTDHAVIINGKMKAIFDKNGKLVFKNQKEQILLEEYHRNRKGCNFIPGEISAGFASALEIEAREFRPVTGGNYVLTMRFEPNSNEKIYGMGQYQQPF